MIRNTNTCTFYQVLNQRKIIVYRSKKEKKKQAKLGTNIFHLFSQLFQSNLFGLVRCGKLSLESFSSFELVVFLLGIELAELDCFGPSARAKAPVIFDLGIFRPCSLSPSFGFTSLCLKATFEKRTGSDEEEWGLVACDGEKEVEGSSLSLPFRSAM